MKRSGGVENLAETGSSSGTDEGASTLGRGRSRSRSLGAYLSSNHFFTVLLQGQKWWQRGRGGRHSAFPGTPGGMVEGLTDCDTADQIPDRRPEARGGQAGWRGR